jgi:hypothetical protein
MTNTTEETTGLAKWLGHGERLVVELHRRRGLLDELCPERNPRGRAEERELLKELSACEMQIGRICMRMAGCEDGFGVQNLLGDEPVTRPLRCAVILLAAVRLSHRPRVGTVGNVMELAAGASVEAALSIRDHFMKGGCLYPIVKSDYGGPHDVVDELSITLPECVFQKLLGRDPSIAEGMPPRY